MKQGLTKQDSVRQFSKQGDLDKLRITLSNAINLCNNAQKSIPVLEQAEKELREMARMPALNVFRRECITCGRETDDDICTECHMYMNMEEDEEREEEI